MMKINPKLKRPSRKHLPKMPTSQNQSPKKFSKQGRHQRKKTRSVSRDASVATFMPQLLPAHQKTKYWSSCLQFQIKSPSFKRSQSCFTNCLSARRLQFLSSALPSTLSSEKKGNTTFAHKGCQTEPTNVNVPVSSHDVC
ncbi:unnamed protein product [Brassica oleracea]